MKGMIYKDKKSFIKFFMMVICLTALVFSTSCGQEIAGTPEPVEEEMETNDLDMWSRLNLTDEEDAYLEDLKEAGSLKVAMREFDTVYVIEGNKIKGLHYSLIRNFADDLGIELDVKLVNFSDYWKDVYGDSKRAVSDTEYAYTPELLMDVDIYCDTITVLPWREKLVEFIPLYPLREVIVRHVSVDIDELADLKDKRIAIQPDTSYLVTLKELEDDLGTSFEYINVESVPEVLPTISKYKADVTLYDSNRAFLEVEKFDNLVVGIPASEVKFTAWAVSKENPELASIMTKYIDYLKSANVFDVLWKEDYDISFVDYLKLLAD